MTPKAIETEKDSADSLHRFVRRSYLKRLAWTFPQFAVIPVITIGFGLPLWTTVVLVGAMMYDGIINTWLTRFD